MSGPLASDAFYNVAPMSDPSFGGGGGSLSPFQQMQQGFQSTMQNIQNDPFPLLEQYLGRQAQSNIDQTLQPMQQQAQEKISGVMSGIRSLVSEAFPNSGGMSTMGQLGSGTLSGGSNSITQPTSPAPFTPAISPSDMGYPKMDLSQISTPAPLLGDPTAPLLGGGGFNPDGGVPVTGKAPYTPQSKPMVGGSGMGNPMALSGPPPTTGPPAGFEKAKGLIDVGTSFTQNGQDYTKQINPFTGQPEVLMVDDIQKQQLLEGKNIFAPPIEAPPSMGSSPIPSILQAPDPNNPLFTPPMTLPKMPVSATIDPTVNMMEYNPAINYNVIKPGIDELDPSDPASPAYNPAMEYNPVFPMPQLPQQDPLINLMYNYNMENSPY